MRRRKRDMAIPEPGEAGDLTKENLQSILPGIAGKSTL